MSSVYCFNDKGQRLWKLSTGCGSAFSMQFFQDRLYLVTTDGVARLHRRERGRHPGRAVRHAAQGPSASRRPSRGGRRSAPTVETTREAGQGVVVECYQDGPQLRVRVLSPGYHKDWHVQFPKDIRQAGARYVVEEVRESARGGFYRAHGDIRRLVG